MNDKEKEILIARLPAFCDFCKQNEGIEWSEFYGKFTEEYYVAAGHVRGFCRGVSLACECTRCGVIVEVKE